ncbi:WAT1-related protein At1g68170-like [Vigna unguiculata]|uniref:WAT1-related protein At1g68170-like n=1 Tax=Vigna unguiculata TaxID=3917 RepID=UPI001016B357|nr:WAT1-related protein At1g68170-like [Vigna unguiculata]
METWKIAQPILVMVMMQIANAWVNILYELALKDGMNCSIIVAYRYVFATVFISPLALIIERNKRSNMTWMILFHAFLGGLIGGTVAQNLSVESITLTSATFTTAMSNLGPGITFIVLLCFRLEKLNLITRGGKMKIIGTIIGISGATIMTFIKGPEIKLTTWFHVHRNDHNVLQRDTISGSKNILGALASLGTQVSNALWLINQTKLTERYPYPYSSTALVTLMGALLSLSFAFCVERDLSEWRLGWNVRLFTVAYSGTVTSGVMYVAYSWCLRRKGPLFVSIFSPLMLVIVAFAGSTILDEKLYLGRPARKELSPGRAPSSPLNPKPLPSSRALHPGRSPFGRVRTLPRIPSREESSPVLGGESRDSSSGRRVPPSLDPPREPEPPGEPNPSPL